MQKMTAMWLTAIFKFSLQNKQVVCRDPLADPIGLYYRFFLLK